MTTARPVPQNFWCHQCCKWQDSESDDHDGFSCLTCGETILCDECGQPWTDDHDDECEAKR